MKKHATKWFLMLMLIMLQTNKIYVFAEGINNGKYETYKMNKTRIINLNEEELPEEVKQDLIEEANMTYLKNKTNNKYEIAMANSNGEFTFVKGFDNLDKAITESKSIASKQKSSSGDIPVIINEKGIVVYATQSIGRLTRLVNGVASEDRRYNVNIYSSSTSKNVLTYVNHGYMDDMPIIDQTSTRVKVEVNGIIGWIDKEEGNVTNVVQVPLNQAKNLSYYKKSGNDLIHYMSSNITGNSGYSSIIGKAPSFMKEGVKYYSYDGNYFYQNIEKLLSDTESGDHKNAINYDNAYYNYYLYLPGRTKTSYTANDINKYLNNNTPSNSILRNKGTSFIQAQEKYGVNASFIVAIAMNESGKGTSTIATTKNNIFGLNAVDSSPGESANYFKTVGDCVNEFASHWMSKGYFNPSDWRYGGTSLGNKGFGVNVRYASDPYWGEKAASYMYAMDKYISSSSLTEYNKYKLGIYNTVANVTNSSGSKLYSSIQGYVVPILSTLGSNYKINLDRQLSYSPSNGNYSWTSEGSVSKSSVTTINTTYTGALNQKQIDVINKFENFYRYGSYSNPTIDLSNSDNKITTYSTAVDILRKTKDGNKTSRQKFLDAWNSLSDSEKNNSKMQSIYKEYTKIISISEAARDILSFYNNVKNNREDLLLNRLEVLKINNKENMDSGARGKAYKEYNEATKHGENSKNSERMNYINQKYLDVVNFLESVELLVGNKADDARVEANKIKDITLKKSALASIDSYTSKYTYNQRQVINRYEYFYIYGQLSSPTIDLTNKNEIIKTESQAISILKTTVNGTKYDRQKFIDAWNKLSSKEKENSRMQSIYSEYKKIVSIAEAARDSFKFFNNSKNNRASLSLDRIEAIRLNSKETMESGARGKAWKEYSEANKYGENSKNSERMKYINQKYLDAVRFLRSVEYLVGNKVESAAINANQIQDTTLKKFAMDNISEYNNKYTYNQRQVINRFEYFYTYGPLKEPIMSLLDKNDVIKTSSRANSLLKTTSNGTVYDRQKFLDAWNKLSSTEKNNSDIKKVNNEYKKMISILEATKANLKFYEHVKSNASTLVKSYNTANKLNSKTNMSLGARGKAYSTYQDAKAYGENSTNSPRMKYIYNQYLDAMNFLDAVGYLKDKDVTNATAKMNKIKDTSLKNTLKTRINQLSK